MRFYDFSIEELTKIIAAVDDDLLCVEAMIAKRNIEMNRLPAFPDQASDLRRFSYLRQGQQ